jgi:MFS family permease
MRLLPFLFVLYIFNYLDRSNVAIAALQMNRDLGFSAAAYGLGAGIFFVGYVLFSVPSNLVLARVGARWWIALIMLTWGLLASAMMFVRTPTQFYLLRFFLGAAEAAFFPGVIQYLSQRFPAEQRARAISRFMIAIPLSSVLGGPLGGWLLGMAFGSRAAPTKSIAPTMPHPALCSSRREYGSGRGRFPRLLPVLFCLPTMLLYGTAAAAGIALINAISSTGGFAGPWFVGALKDATGGVTGSFLTLAALGVLAAALCLLLRRQAAFIRSPR